MKKAKILKIERNREFRGTIGGLFDVYDPVTWATLDNGDRIYINEDEIREVYDRERITVQLIRKVNEDWCGKEVKYDENDLFKG